MDKNSQFLKCACVCMLTGPRSKHSPEAMCTCPAQILASKTIPHKKEPEVIREVAEFRARAGKVQDRPGNILLSQGKKRDMLETMRKNVKEGIPTGRIWDKWTLM